MSKLQVAKGMEIQIKTKSWHYLNAKHFEHATHKELFNP